MEEGDAEVSPSGTARLRGLVRLKPVTESEKITATVIRNTAEGLFTFEGELDITLNLPLNRVQWPPSQYDHGPFFKKKVLPRDASELRRWAYKNAKSIMYTTIAFEVVLFCWVFLRPYSEYEKTYIAWAARLLFAIIFDGANVVILHGTSDIAWPLYIGFYVVSSLFWFLYTALRDGVLDNI